MRSSARASARRARTSARRPRGGALGSTRSGAPCAYLLQSDFLPCIVAWTLIAGERGRSARLDEELGGRQEHAQQRIDDRVDERSQHVALDAERAAGTRQLARPLRD